MEKPREFWLAESDSGAQLFLEKPISIGDEFYDGYNAQKTNAKEVIHVIEYSAYETLRTELQNKLEIEKSRSDLYQKHLQIQNANNIEREAELQSEREKTESMINSYEFNREALLLGLRTEKEKVTELQAEIESLKKLLYDSPEIQDNIESIKKITLEQAAQKYVNESGYKSCRHRMFLTFLKGAEWFQDKKYEELEAEKEKVTKLRAALLRISVRVENVPHVDDINAIREIARSVLAEIGDENV